MLNAPVPAAAPVLPSANRRRLLLGAAAATLVAPAALAAEPHPDAALLAHREAVIAAMAVVGPLLEEGRRLYDLAFAMVGERPYPPVNETEAEARAWHQRFDEARKSTGYTETWERMNEADVPINTFVELALEHPAVTLEGLHLKALVADFHEGYNDALVAAIIDDLLALGGRAQA